MLPKRKENLIRKSSCEILYELSLGNSKVDLGLPVSESNPIPSNSKQPDCPLVSNFEPALFSDGILEEIEEWV